MKEELFDVIRVCDIANQTTDAFSYDAWGQLEWRRVAGYLLRWHNDPAKVEEILRSKHMRWCRDGLEEGEIPTLEAFEKYYLELYRKS